MLVTVNTVLISSGTQLLEPEISFRTRDIGSEIRVFSDFFFFFIDFFFFLAVLFARSDLHSTTHSSFLFVYPDGYTNLSPSQMWQKDRRSPPVR